MAELLESTASDALTDMQTSVIAGVAGTLTGQLSNYLGDEVEKLMGTGASNNPGAVTLNLVLRSFLSSLTYVSVARVMPETTNNIYYSFVTFQADRGLTAAVDRFGAMVAAAINQLSSGHTSKGKGSQ